MHSRLNLQPIIMKTRWPANSTTAIFLSIVLYFCVLTANTQSTVHAFAVSSVTTRATAIKSTFTFTKLLKEPQQHQNSCHNVLKQQQPWRVVTILYAGGFEWQDPSDAAFDQGVENPFKKAEINDEPLKVDPARLLGPRLSGTNLYFVGMMGTGKSTIGDKLARRMGTYNFLDTDTIIEKAVGMSIPDIFAQEGEEAFREVEKQVLNSVHPYVRCVISTGGGIVLLNENWSKLQTGLVIWLDVEPEVIMKRIEGTNRPLLQTEDPLKTLKDLLEKRRDKYSNADIQIRVTESMSEDDVVLAVVKELHDFIDENPPAWKLAKAKAQSEGLDWVK